MKIISNTVGLSTIIAKVSKACSRNKNGLPILQYLLFKKEGNDYSLVASSEDLWVQHRIEFVGVEGEWHDFCLPMGSATTAIGMLPDQPITIEVADEAENGSYSIKFTTSGENGKVTTFDSVALSSTEYPVRDLDRNTAKITVPTKSLLTCMKEAAKYVAIDPLRPVMMGTYLLFENDQFTVVGTDGHRLYRNHIKCDVEGLEDGKQASVDVPVGVEPILSSCAADTEEIRVGISDKQVSFVTQNAVVISTVYEGRYPNYNSVIPKNSKVAVFNKRELVTATRLVRNFAPTDTDILCMSFSSSMFMELSTTDLDFASSARDSVIIVDSDKIGNLRIGMKGSSLLTCLSDIQTENVKMKFDDSMHAITIHEDSEESELLILLMPMQLND